MAVSPRWCPVDGLEESARGALDRLPREIAYPPRIGGREVTAPREPVLERHEARRGEEQRGRVAGAPAHARQRQEEGEALTTVHARLRRPQRIALGGAAGCEGVEQAGGQRRGERGDHAL